MTLKSGSAAVLLAAFVAAPLASASTKENVENYMAQRLVKEYTGTLDEHVDARFGEALASVAGCQLGEFFKKEGMEAAAALAKQQASERIRLSRPNMNAAAEKAAHKAIDLAKARADKRLADALEKSCDKSKWPKKLGTHNVDVAEDILVILEPQIRANREALLRGDIMTVADAIVGEGTKLGRVVKNLGEIDLATNDYKFHEWYFGTQNTGQLLALAGAYKADYERLCEPNRTYAVRRHLEKVRNKVSNAIEMTISPVETMIEILVEKIIGGDMPKFKADSIAITKHDGETHDHTQHEQQNAACFDAEAKLELVNRQLRAVALGGDPVRPVSAQEMRRNGLVKKGVLFDVMPSRANAAARDAAISSR